MLQCETIKSSFMALLCVFIIYACRYAYTYSVCTHSHHIYMHTYIHTFTLLKAPSPPYSPPYFARSSKDI